MTQFNLRLQIKSNKKKLLPISNFQSSKNHVTKLIHFQFPNQTVQFIYEINFHHTINLN